jgi:hypothetical protein
MHSLENIFRQKARWLHMLFNILVLRACFMRHHADVMQKRSRASHKHLDLEIFEEIDHSVYHAYVDRPLLQVTRSATVLVQEEFEDSKGIIRIRISKNKQNNDQNCLTTKFAMQC